MNITKGKIKKPFFMVLYGREKIGKTTFVAGAKDIIIIGPEDGSNNLEVERADVAQSFEEVLENIQWLRKEKHDYKTVAIDSLTKIEPMLWDSVCKLDGSKTIETAQKGYGKGFVVANQYWQTMIDALHDLKNNRGMNIIAIAHALSKQFNDPLLLQPYNRYFLQMNDKAAALWTREVDCLGFATIETFLKEGDSEKLNRALSENKRVLHLAPSPAFEAGNRLGLPDEIRLDFSAFESSMNTAAPKEKEKITYEELLKSAMTLLSKVKDQATRQAAEKFIKEAQTHEDLEATVNRLKQIT